VEVGSWRLEAGGWATECTVARAPLIRIRDFNFRRDALPALLAGAGLALAIAGGVWDGAVAVVVAFLIVSSNVVRRIEWRGRGMPGAIADRSVFREGIGALPNDVVTLAVIAFALPAGAIIVALSFPTVWAWIGVAVNSLISLAALTAMIIELRRRSKAT